MFKACGNNLDIILPKKRDRNGKRYGFAHTHDEKEAGVIINNAKMEKLGRKINMRINSAEEAPGFKDSNPNRGKSGSDPRSPHKDKKQEEPEQDFEKKMFEFTEVEVDEEIKSALLDCKVAYSWFDEDAINLNSNLMDMGLSKYRVKSISSRKFFIRKDKGESWDELENTDLSVWFCKIRKFEEQDLVVSRIVWLECRSLPMPAWQEDNLKAFTDRLGGWLSWSYQSDGLCEFFNPLICLDVWDFDRIQEDMKILYKWKVTKIQFVEIVDQNYLKGKVLPMELSLTPKDKGKQENKNAGSTIYNMRSPSQANHRAEEDSQIGANQEKQSQIYSNTSSASAKAPPPHSK